MSNARFLGGVMSDDMMNRISKVFFYLEKPTDDFSLVGVIERAGVEPSTIVQYLYTIAQYQTPDKEFIDRIRAKESYQWYLVQQMSDSDREIALKMRDKLLGLLDEVPEDRQFTFSYKEEMRQEFYYRLELSILQMTKLARVNAKAKRERAKVKSKNPW